MVSAIRRVRLQDEATGHRRETMGPRFESCPWPKCHKCGGFHEVSTVKSSLTSEILNCPVCHGVGVIGVPLFLEPFDPLDESGWRKRRRRVRRKLDALYAASQPGSPTRVAVLIAYNRSSMSMPFMEYAGS